MKATKIFRIALLCVVAQPAIGQELQIPNTPAFSILGYEPTAVMRPTSTKKLSSDLLNSFDENGKLLLNIGMEVTPYWLKSRPGLSREEYLNPKPLQSFLQTLSFSAATVKDTVTGKNNLGAGFRFQLVKGKLTDEFAIHEKKLKQTLTAMSAITAARSFAGTNITSINGAIDFVLVQLKAIGTPEEQITEIEQRAIAISKKYKPDGNGVYATATIRSFCQELIETFEAETNVLANTIIELQNRRTGFSLEIAGAGKFITTTQSQAFQKAGVWINANNYFTEQDAWTVTARYMTNTSDTTSTNFDMGIGYIKTGKDFNVSVEGLMRWYRAEIPDFNSEDEPITRLEKDFTYRFAAQLSYAIAEEVSVNISLGKDFDDATISGTGFFSILGINYSLFNKQKALMPRNP